MHRDLGLADALGVGMFLQTLLLALTECGLGTCVQVSIAAYPDILRAHLDIPEEQTVLCGLAIGNPDPAFPGNSLAVPRNGPHNSSPTAHGHVTRPMPYGDPAGRPCWL